jgi:hypothetical protein
LVDAWPRAVPFDELPGVSSEPDQACEILHALFGAGLVEVRASQPRFALTPCERPVASPLARLQASQSRPLTTLRHTTVTTTGPVENHLISLLDGSRTRADLLSTLTPLIQSAKSPDVLAAELDTSLNTLGRLCLLVS